MTDLEEYLRWRGLDCHVVTNCEDYENCDVCLFEHIKKHDEKVRQDAIEELVGRILSNCTLKSTGEMVLEIRMDIFNFIVNQLKGEHE